MKQRFTSLDIRATVNELNAHLSGKYIQNFYATEQRFFFLKFSNKDVLLIEPGMRMHLVKSHGTEISHFCKKLREKCRNTKISRIYQHGFDRIVVLDLQRYRVVVEFFSAGNVIILDDEDNIVELHRPVPDIGMIKGKKYIWNLVELECSYEQFQTVGLAGIFPFEKEFIVGLESELNMALNEEPSTKESKQERVEHFLNETKKRVENLGWYGEVHHEKLVPSQLYAFLCNPECIKVSKFLKPNKTKNIAKDVQNLQINSQKGTNKLDANESIRLIDKEQIETLIKSTSKSAKLEFDSFNAASEYAFSGFTKKVKDKGDKTERIRTAQAKYISELTIQADANREKAQNIEEHREFIADILRVFKKVYNNKMEWKIFELFYREELRRENELSKAIVRYDLEKGTAILDLDGMLMEIDLHASASKNIEAYYTKARKAESKASKTEKAMESLHRDTNKSKRNVKPQTRIPYWFERFNFFIGTDGTLVLGGKNLQDNELLVKNYLEKDDLYFHCDTHGASSVICKGRGDIVIVEAACMALTHSKSWEERVLSPVFWVEPSQVSKTAPSGEYLARGSFMISGKKNFINLPRLEYGVGIIFKEEGSQPLEFVGKPTGSEILHGMPVAAPWCVVKNYKYRVRITPGTSKKSQVCQNVMKVLCDMAEGESEECVVRAVGLDEYMKVVPGKSKISKAI